MDLGGERGFPSLLHKEYVSPGLPYFQNEVPSKCLGVSFGFQSRLNFFGPEKEMGNCEETEE